MTDQVVCLKNTHVAGKSGKEERDKQPQACSSPVPSLLVPICHCSEAPSDLAAASASEDESMSGAMSKQVICARNCKKKKKPENTLTYWGDGWQWWHRVYFCISMKKKTDFEVSINFPE